MVGKGFKPPSSLPEDAKYFLQCLKWLFRMLCCKEAIKIFEPLGKSVLVGPCGAGQLAKLANQAIVGITIGAVAEAVLLLERGGVNVDSVREALSGGFADSAILQQHGKRMSDRNFEAGGSIKTQLKDMQNILVQSFVIPMILLLIVSIMVRSFQGGDVLTNLHNCVTVETVIKFSTLWVKITQSFHRMTQLQ